jgi:twinkle protein
MLLPRGRRQNKTWYAGSVLGEEGRSLQVTLAGAHVGHWQDWATGERGDLIDLWRMTRHPDLRQTLAEVRDYLGVKPPPRFLRREKPKRPAYLGATRALEPAKPAHGPALEYLLGRKLLPVTLAAYKVMETNHQGYGPAVVFPYYVDNVVSFAKWLVVKREDGKKVMWTSGKDTAAVLFGLQVYDPKGRECIITEGEISAMSWWQVTGIPAYATPYGGGKGSKHTEWIENCIDLLDQYERIYLDFDDDQPGREAALDLAQRLGRHRCYLTERLTSGGKDINDYLQAGVPATEIMAILDRASPDDPSVLRSPGGYVDDVCELLFPPTPVSRGFRMPFGQMGGMMYGQRREIEFRPGHTSIWTGFSGHAKTTLLCQIALDAARQGERCCIASFETTPAELLLILMQQAMGLSFTVSNLPRGLHQDWVRQQATEAADWLDGKIWILDLPTDSRMQTTELLDVYEYTRHRYGCTQAFTDSLMCLDISEDDYNGQKVFLNDLVRQARRCGMHHHLVAHVRKESSDENKPPTKLSVRGSIGMTDRASYVFGVWRNKPKERKVQELVAREKVDLRAAMLMVHEPDLKLVTLKNRLTGMEPTADLYFDYHTGQFHEAPGAKPWRYVEATTQDDENDDFSQVVDLTALRGRT